jgi:dephospho-CoA kinase
MEREGIDEDYALAKIHSQMDLYLKKEMADYVIDSSGTFDETKLLVLNVINDIKGVL